MSELPYDQIDHEPTDDPEQYLGMTIIESSSITEDDDEIPDSILDYRGVTQEGSVS